jgi:hypothetical protein
MLSDKLGCLSLLDFVFLSDYSHGLAERSKIMPPPLIALAAHRSTSILFDERNVAVFDIKILWNTAILLPNYVPSLKKTTARERPCSIYYIIFSLFLLECSEFFFRFYSKKKVRTSNQLCSIQQ